MRLPLLACVLATTACAKGVMVDNDHPDAAGPGNGTTHDAPEAPEADAATPHDGPGVVTPDGPSGGGGGGGATLLLTEVVLAPSTGEFIEIANPTGAAIDLSHYYLSDSGNYFRVPAGSPTVDTTDFIAKFPAGASIASHAVITVALDTTANFTTAYGAAPTYSIASATMNVIAVSGTPSLTNAGELVALFQWDGTSDLVKDVDLVLAGAPTAANGLVDKNGVALDGPDTGTTTSAYASDGKTMAVMGSTPASGKSTKRLLPEAGHETQGGSGNGITGDDETTEDTATTWDSSGFTNPTPGTVPSTLLM